ncbi:GNAT family N-acetyltransferase [Salegentibacter chungangensis]|uniref:GNAT family N-acetyltransferase n=1 Tax=Salegentibacter chungangensis TaxID=1335724 RepID=A0ABW3NR18_9FLAO
MEIREAVNKDIPEILKVLKASLGETSSKKTEEVWRFKHVDNPFGRSLVLLAEEGGEVVGVRAFMRWKWQEGNQVFSAFRAVDTATHPNYQGKGIFKKLTKKALEVAANNGDHFVFNTPNKQSKPGYLKMGWEEVGKLNVGVFPVNPFYWSKKENIEKYGVVWNDEIKLDFFDNWNEKLEKTGKLFTPKSESYLNWRYVNNPLQKYKVFFNNGFFIAGYVKKHTYFKELRISEVILSSDYNKKSLKKKVKNWTKELGVNLVSFNIPGGESLNFYSFTGKFGPILTFKGIDENLDDSYFLNNENWEYSLGDLELF